MRPIMLTVFVSYASNLITLSDFPTGGVDTNSVRPGVNTCHGLNPANGKVIGFYSSAEGELRLGFG